MKKLQTNGKRLLAFLLAILVTLGTVITERIPVYAASGTLTFNSGETISYGDYFTTRMTFDGDNKAYCVEPLKPTPAAGTYEYDLLSNGSPVRKALYYLPGGYGYEKETNKHLSGWAEDDAYVIGHLVVAYIYAGYDSNSGAFYGAPQNYIDKALEVVNAINSLPEPPESFRAFIVLGSGNQTIAGSWYKKPYGWIELQKTNSNPGITDGNGSYSLKGAQYGIYKGSQLVETLTTDKNGYAKSGDLEADTDYTVREITASPGFAVDPNGYDVRVKSEAGSTLKVKENPQSNPINLLLQKLDAETKGAAAQGRATLQGAEFTIKFYAELSDSDPAASGKKPVRSWIFKTDAQGKIQFTKDYLVSGDEFFYADNGKTPCLPIGTVTIQETKAPVGYTVTETVFTQKITGSGNKETLSVFNAPNVEDLVIRGGVTVQKRDLETAGATPQGGATLEGAKFTITTLNDNPVIVNGKSYTKDQDVLTLTTNQAGQAATPDDTLPYGHYRVTEKESPNGYLNAGKLTLEFDITENGQMIDLTSEETSIHNQVIRGGVKVQKRDLETLKDKAQGGATLEGAQFTITSLNNNPVVVEGKTYTKDQVVFTLTTDKNGLSSTKKDTLPYGHYRVDETIPPEGYLNSGKISIEFDIVEDGKIVELTAEDSSILNQVIRGDLEFVKVSDGDLNRLANVPFAITSKTTGESHVIVTDKNGYASTSSEWNKHTSNTNEGKTSKDGIWFGTSAPDDTKGALIYDTYTIEEQRCETNEGMNLLKFDVTIYKDSVTIPLGTLTDDQITIATTALDQDSDSHLAQPHKEITLVDTVEYEGLKKGKEYKLIGTLMDKESGKPVEIDGKPVTAESTFTAKKTSGSTKVTFTFDATSLKGRTIVVFEELYQEDLLLAVHTDIEDQDQTIYFPEIGTTARDADTDTNLSHADEEVTLIDTVTYKNLFPGQKYHITGTLMDKETEKPVEVDGKPITAEASFTAKESNGTVEVTFTFPGSSLAGKTVVVFESVLYKNKEVAVHADLTDEGQTIYFPEIGTTAVDKENGTHLAYPDKEVTILDTVNYTNLIPGKEYKISGTLMDKETGKALEIDGKPVTAEDTFTPEESSGSIELTFTFDGSALKGKTIVAFESVTCEEKEIASHTDIEDMAQTIHFPEISTTAKDGADDDKEAVAEEKVTIIDTVAYKNLVPDSKYKVSGILMDKETGKEVQIDGKPVIAETEFTAEKAEGSVDVTFTFNGTSLAGHDVVVFEKLFLLEKDREIEVAYHEDIKDEGQTIKLTEVPKEETPKETPDVSAPVKTGDETPIFLYVGLAVAALAIAGGLGVLYWKKRKNAKK